MRQIVFGVDAADAITNRNNGKHTHTHKLVDRNCGAEWRGHQGRSKREGGGSNHDRWMMVVSMCENHLRAVSSWRNWEQVQNCEWKLVCKKIYIYI